MPIPEKFIEELVERSDIVDVVSSYVRLGKKSGANLFGLCPFHSEKTPSFSVSPDKQIYHCFGCGKGGGVISFIMEIENLGYRDAVAFLARRAGMTLPEETNDAESRRRARMLALNKAAARFFYSQLSTEGGRAACEYMARRQISPEVARRFGLGAAPDSWDSLEKAMRAEGFTDLELADAGLVRRGKSAGFYDTFRNRLMFPVIDVRGNVIGFSGRILGDGEPKYMNSPETLVFNKSRNLFALNLAKKSKSGYILLTEGNIDVVSLHQAGFDSAVASLGTSLTAEQARLISRYTNEVIIAYDSDGAGLKASQRAIGILEKLDLKVRVLRMTGAKDPDEFIKTRGAEAFRKLLEGSENQVDYRLNTLARNYDLSDTEQKLAFLDEAYDIVARLPESTRREIYAAKLAAMVEVKEQAVLTDVEARHKRLLRHARGSEQREAMRVEKRPASGEKKPRYDNLSSAVGEEGVIRLLSFEPELGVKLELPGEEEFTAPALREIYHVLRERIARHESVNPAMLSGVLSSEQLSLLISLQDKPERLANSEQAMRDYIRKIRESAGGGSSLSLREQADKYRRSGKGYKDG